MLKKSLQRFEDIPNLHQKINAVSDVINNRPSPLRKYDQIYMKAADMVLQAELVQGLIDNKDVIFMGDGDSMAITFAYLSSLGLINKGPKRSVVLDFDERIVRAIQRFAREKCLEEVVEAYLYNVVDPVPLHLSPSFNAFYINPPYGSTNAGQSAIVFIDRCLELCLSECTGCVILPYDGERVWTRTAMYEIQSYAIEVGLVISEMLREIHSYHLDDDPNLLSSTLIFERVCNHLTRFQNSVIPLETLRNFYGREVQEIPHYIRAVTPNGNLEYFEDKEW